VRCALSRYGEPLLNYDNVIRAAQILSHPAARPSPATPFLFRQWEWPRHSALRGRGHRFRLIISLAAATSEARLPLVPAEKRWPLAEVMAAVREYAASCRSRVTFAYVGISGVNMAREDARKLAELLTGLRAKVTLIDVNDDTGRYQPPTDYEVREFRDELLSRHIPVSRATLAAAKSAPPADLGCDKGWGSGYLTECGPVRWAARCRRDACCIRA